MGITSKVYWTILRLSRSNTLFRKLIDYGALFYYKVFRASKTFEFQGTYYKYFYHLYNRTVASERIVEVPIAKAILDSYSKKRILEVGNVLSHYYPIHHLVLDKFEIAPGVMNADVTNFALPDSYDLILSISTMEHVGYNAYPYTEDQDPQKFLLGIANLKKHLAPGGKLFVTLPLFFNPFIDNLVNQNKMPFTSCYYLKRTNYLNEWEEVSSVNMASSSKYDGHFANANYIYIGVYENI